jgi:hypothetical protein
MSGFITAVFEPDYLLILDRRYKAFEDRVERLTTVVLELSSLVESALKTFAHTVFNVAI